MRTRGKHRYTQKEAFVFLVETVRKLAYKLDNLKVYMLWRRSCEGLNRSLFLKRRGRGMSRSVSGQKYLNGCHFVTSDIWLAGGRFCCSWFWGGGGVEGVTKINQNKMDSPEPHTEEVHYTQGELHFYTLPSALQEVIQNQSLLHILP